MVPAILFGVLLASAIVGIGYAIISRRFHETPEYQWKQRVVRHSADLAERRRRLSHSAPPTPEQAVENERRVAIEIARRNIPLERLTGQPGIGPGAVGLLRQSGVHDIPTVLRANLVAINGIGPQKAALLQVAAEALLMESDALFAAGRSREGAELAARADGIRMKAIQACSDYNRTIAALDAALAAHREAERLASLVTLVGYVKDDPIHGLDAARMAQPFPTPDGMAAAAPVSSSPALSSSTAVPQRLAAAAEFGMFLVHFGGPNRNHRTMRLRLALRSMFGEGDSPTVAEINKHLKPRLKPEEWFARLNAKLSASDRESLLEKVLGPENLRTTDERRLAVWIARGGVRKASPTSSPELKPTVSGAEFVPSKSTPTSKVQAKGAVASSAGVRGDLMAELLEVSEPLPKLEPIRRHPQQDRLEAFARFGVMVALADGRAAQAELRAVRTFLGELFGHEPELLRRIDPVIELAMASRLSFESAVANAKGVAAGSEELTRLYRWAGQVADASSGRNEREEVLLARIAEEWQIADRRSKPAIALVPEPPFLAAVAPTIDPRLELGIPADAEITVELVRRRYNLLSDQLDSTQLDGLGEEFMRLAAMKREKIEAAALTLLQPHGASLAPATERPPADPRHNPDLDAVFGA